LDLNLRPGEPVRIRSRDEIIQTLDRNNKNRGMWFDAEMAIFCGEVHPVLCRVRNIIDNQTGELIRLSNECIILDGVTNRGVYHGFNPRHEYPFWREIWLERVSKEPDRDTREDLRETGAGGPRNPSTDSEPRIG
jgi:hypothetical protein